MSKLVKSLVLSASISDTEISSTICYDDKKAEVKKVKQFESEEMEKKERKRETKERTSRNAKGKSCYQVGKVCV